MRVKILLFLCGVLLVGLPDAFGSAADYPNKPIRLVTPYAPGGSTDLVGRAIAKNFTERWGQQVILDSRPGGAGTIAAMTVAKAQPDGYMLLFATSTVMVTNPLMMTSATYNPRQDFSPLGRIAVVPLILVAHPSVPANTVKEVVALARKTPGTLTFASSGTGGVPHLALELLKSAAGIQVIHVPYKGAAPALIDIVAGYVQFGFSSISTALPHLKTGRLKGLAVSGAKRSAVVPEVPTISESGFPGYECVTWYAFFTTAGTPRPIVDKVSGQLRQALGAPAIVKQLLEQGQEPAPMTPSELGDYLRVETERWARIIKEQNLKLE
jgi:tripartite-type tricarboxylate transporter receptor subunit TctC